MDDYGRRIVIDSGYEAVVGELSRAIREEGLQVVARIDVRDRFWRDLRHDFRRYVLIEAWSPELALEALRRHLEIGPILPTTFAVYELADGETALVAKQPFARVTESDWRQDDPALAAIANREVERVNRILARLRPRASFQASELPAA